MWIAGSIGRPIKFVLDGRRWARSPTKSVIPSSLHRRARSSAPAATRSNRCAAAAALHPGSGDDVDPDTGELGPIVLIPGGASCAVKVAPAARRARVCSAPVGYQWMEMLRAGASV